MLSSLVETAGLCHPLGERQERKGCSFRMLTSLLPREFTIHCAPASLGGVAQGSGHVLFSPPRILAP